MAFFFLAKRLNNKSYDERHVMSVFRAFWIFLHSIINTRFRTRVLYRSCKQITRLRYTDNASLTLGWKKSFFVVVRNAFEFGRTVSLKKVYRSVTTVCKRVSIDSQHSCLWTIWENSVLILIFTSKTLDKVTFKTNLLTVASSQIPPPKKKTFSYINQIIFFSLFFPLRS